MARAKELIKVNIDFFKELNRDTAWVYGWLVTDGSVQEKAGHIKLELKTHDKDVLYKIKDKMDFSGIIRDAVKSDGRQSSVLRICRKSMCEDLFNLGLARKDKTNNTTFPNDLTDELYWDFIRGVFEGDGSISHYTGNTDDLRITLGGATKSFMEELQSTLEKRGVRMTMRRNNSNVLTLTNKSNADALRMCYFMYANTTDDDRLRRKFNVFQNYVVTYYDKVKRRSTPCIELVELARQTIAECRDDYNATSTQKAAV